MSRFQRKTEQTPMDQDDPVAAHSHASGHDFEISTGHTLGTGNTFEPHVDSGLDPRFVPSSRAFDSSATRGFGALNADDDDFDTESSPMSKTESKNSNASASSTNGLIGSGNRNIFSEDDDSDMNRLIEARNRRRGYLNELDASNRVTSCKEDLVSCWRFVAESWKRCCLFLTCVLFAGFVLFIVSTRSGSGNPYAFKNNHSNNNNNNNQPPSPSSSSILNDRQFDILPTEYSSHEDFNDQTCDINAYKNLTRLVYRVFSGASKFSKKQNQKSEQDFLHLLRKQFIFCVYKCPFNNHSVALKKEAGWNAENDDHDHSGYHARIKGSKDAFAIDKDKKSGSRIVITASTRVAASRGFYWYLKHVLNSQVTWGADQLDAFLMKLDEEMIRKILTGTSSASSNSNAIIPLVKNRVAIISTVPWRHAWNMVTFGYTSTWWDWERWERELDWMALHGVNLPLAFVGQEYVWIQAFAQYGIQPEEMEAWFAGPAFLPWQRGGNVMGFGGPLPMQWIMDQRDLQRKILKRMREFGMTPVLPCFAGHVPAAAKRAWPHGTYSKVGVWNNFPSEYADVLVIDPTDEAFHDIGAAFMKAQEKIYGLSGYYSCDTFNENDPKSDSADYLGNASKAVVDGIITTDPNGVWLMQAWLFSPGHFPWWQQPNRVRRYLEGADRDHFIALDLHAEDGSLSIKFNNFYGKASIWCMLHNYGGVRAMYGALQRIATKPFEDMAQDKDMIAFHLSSSDTNSDNKKYFKDLKTTILGLGFVPESIEQNPIIYELMTETFFGLPKTSASFDHSLYPAAGASTFKIDTWVQNYITQRYLNGVSKFVQDTTTNNNHLPSEELSQLYKKIKNPDQNHFMVKMWKAWNQLLDGFYSSEDSPRTDLEMVPMIGSQLGTWKFGKSEVMFDIFQQFVSAVLENEIDPELSPTLHYDAVDVARQAATMFFTDVHVMWINVGKYLGSTEQKASFDKMNNFLLDLITKIDDVLGTDKNFLLGVWMEGARKAASTTPNAADRAKAEKLFKYNAKNQITMWGPKGQISDYAAKPWSGLYKYYYRGRYNVTGEYIKSVGGVRNGNSWNRDQVVLDFEVKWNENSQDDALYPSTPSGQTWKSTAVKLMEHIAVFEDELDSKFKKYDKVISSYPSYELYREYDSMPLWTKEPRELARLCLVVDTCKGFTSNGFLLSKAPEESSLTHQSSSNENLWLKK